jgi:hypothetical protein
MRSSIKLLMGAAASFSAILATRYMAYINLTFPFLDVVAVIAVAVIPGVVGGAFMISAVAAALGSTLAVLCWLTMLYTPITGEVAMISSSLSLEPTIGYIIFVSAAFVVSGLIGHAVSVYASKPIIEEERPEALRPEEKAGEAPQVSREKIQEPAEIEAPAPSGSTAPGLETPEAEEEIYTICKYCSEPVPEGAVYCPHCGKKVK